MTIRALIVLLGILNLGVAAWWWFHTEPAPEPLPEPPAGAVRLQLLQERRSPAATSNATGPAVVSKTTSAPPADAETDDARAATAETEPPTQSQDICMRIGPFTDNAKLTAAQQALRGRVLRQSASQTRVETPATGKARAWRVWLPPAADRAAAAATAQRIAAAGFSDYFVIADGADANAISLGRFSSEERAQQHASALRAAGFPARADAIGDGGSAGTPEVRIEHWLEIVARAPFDTATARGLANAAVRTTTCARKN